MIEINKLTIHYDQIRVVKDASFKVKKGSIAALIGSNGAGKSTIGKALMGLIPISKGEISFLGKRIDGWKPKQILMEGICFVTNEPLIFPRMTVRDNLILGGHLFKSSIQRNIEKAFEMFPVLKEKESQLAGTLSGGERQSLIISRGLMANPRLMIVDEISSGLAPKLANLVYEKLRFLNEKGMTILIIEQYVQRAFEMAEMIYVMENGSIVAEGYPSELENNPVIKKAYMGFEE